MNRPVRIEGISSQRQPPPFRDSRNILGVVVSGGSLVIQPVTM